MFSSKIRTTIITLVASAGLASAAAVPAVSQAQWHTYCVSGHCITHSNYTLGGAEVCPTLSGNYNKAYEGLLEALQTQKEVPNQVHPEMTEAEAKAAVEEAEAQVHLAEIAAFEWGCSIAAHTSSTTTVVGTVSVTPVSPTYTVAPVTSVAVGATIG